MQLDKKLEEKIKHKHFENCEALALALTFDGEYEVEMEEGYTETLGGDYRIYATLKNEDTSSFVAIFYALTSIMYTIDAVLLEVRDLKLEKEHDTLLDDVGMLNKAYRQVLDLSTHEDFHKIEMLLSNIIDKKITRLHELKKVLNK